MNFLLGNQCFLTFREKFNLHSNPFSRHDYLTHRFTLSTNKIDDIITELRLDRVLNDQNYSHNFTYVFKI